MGDIQMNRNAALCSIIVSFLCVVSLGGGSSAYGATTTHVFDPVLSLTGSCATSTVDSVPDPGCPDLHAPTDFTYPPRSVATDRHGNIFIAISSDLGTNGWIDIFKASGEFITRVPDNKGPRSIAVDSKGNLYVFDFDSTKSSERAVWLYEPTEYDSAAGKIAYGKAPKKAIADPNLSNLASIEINLKDDHLFVLY